MPYKNTVGAIKLVTGRALNVSESRIGTSGKQVLHLYYTNSSCVGCGWMMHIISRACLSVSEHELWLWLFVHLLQKHKCACDICCSLCFGTASLICHQRKWYLCCFIYLINSYIKLVIKAFQDVKPCECVNSYWCCKGEWHCCNPSECW